MWHSRFFGTLLAVLTLLGFMESQTALAAYSTSSEFSMSQPQETRGLDGSFQLAVMVGSAVPLDNPLVKSSETVQPEKPAVAKPKATPKASKPKKKKVKKAHVKKAPAKKQVEEEGGFLTNAFKKLVGGDDDKKKAVSKPKTQKTAGKKSEKEEEGFLTKTLKTLVGGDKKEVQTAKKNDLNPINRAPIGSLTQKKEKEQPKTAKAETKKTLKDSFEKLIGVGTVNDDGNSQSAKKEKSGGLLGGILGGSDKKQGSLAKKQAKVEDTVKKKSTPAKPRKLTARKYIEEEEEEQLGKNYGGAKKGKNVLKESFKALVTDDKKNEEEE